MQTLYKINKNEINKIKKQAKDRYKAYIDWSRLKDYKIYPPDLGVVFTDCTIHYKYDGLINFKGYYLYIHRTKDRIKV